MKLRFSIGFLLLAVAIAAGFFAYLAFRRTKGSDQLQQTLRNVGAKNTEELAAQPKPSKDTTAWDRLFANVSEVKPEIRFGADKVDRFDGKKLADTSAVDKVTKVVFNGTELDQDTPFFLEHWTSVGHVEFLNVSTIPDSWKIGLENSATIKRVMFAGYETNVSVEELSRLKNLEFVIVSNLNIWGETLSRLRQALPDTDVYAGGDFGQQWPYKPGVTLSKHDASAKKYMGELLSELKAAFAQLDPPASNLFNPPATIEEIAALEHKIGQPLPPCVRAYLEIHNGQPRLGSPYLTAGHFLSTQEIQSEYGNWLYVSHAYSHDREKKHYAEYWNPRLLPVVGKAEYTVAVDLYNRHLIKGDSEDSHTDYDGTLSQLLRGTIDSINKGQIHRFESNRVVIDVRFANLLPRDYEGCKLKAKSYPPEWDD